jgi:hypothetical protein
LGSIEKRLARLEERTRRTAEDEVERIRAGALTRVTDEDLKLLIAYLRRSTEEGGEPTEEEAAALRRYEELYKEVGRGFAGAQSREA